MEKKWVRDGKVWTSGVVGCGVDMMVEVLREWEGLMGFGGSSYEIGLVCWGGWGRLMWSCSWRSGEEETYITRTDEAEE